jgi:hypothetical protein
MSGSFPTQSSASPISAPAPAAPLSRAEQKAKQDAANAQTALDTLKATAKSAASKPSRTAIQDRVKLLQARLKALMMLKSMHSKGIASEAADILRELKQLVSDYQSLGPSPSNSPATAAAGSTATAVGSSTSDSSGNDNSGGDSSGGDSAGQDSAAQPVQDQRQAALDTAQSMQAVAKDPTTYQNKDQDFYSTAQLLIQQAHDLAKAHGAKESGAPILSIRA